MTLYSLAVTKHLSLNFCPRSEAVAGMYARYGGVCGGVYLRVCVYVDVCEDSSVTHFRSLWMQTRGEELLSCTENLYTLIHQGRSCLQKLTVLILELNPQNNKHDFLCC